MVTSPPVCAPHPPVQNFSRRARAYSSAPPPLRTILISRSSCDPAAAVRGHRRGTTSQVLLLVLQVCRVVPVPVAAAWSVSPAPTPPVVVANRSWSGTRGFSYQPYFPSVGGTGVEIWGQPAVFNISSIERDFAAARAVYSRLNSLRLWMSVDGYVSNPGSYADQLASVLGLGERFGIRYIVTLFNW